MSPADHHLPHRHSPPFPWLSRCDVSSSRLLDTLGWSCALQEKSFSLLKSPVRLLCSSSKKVYTHRSNNNFFIHVQDPVLAYFFGGVSWQSDMNCTRILVGNYAAGGGNYPTDLPPGKRRLVREMECKDVALPMRRWPWRSHSLGLRCSLMTFLILVFPLFL